MSEAQQSSPERKRSSLIKPIGIGCGGLLLLLIIIIIAAGPDAGTVRDERSGVDSTTVISSQPDQPEATEDSGAGLHSRLLRKSDFGEKWPLSVEQGIVECRDSMAVLFHANGKTYPVNGTAKGWYRDLPKIEEIWLKDTARPGLRIDISPILESGRKLCE